MKKIFFYGCSFTAGDELSDSEYPELCNHPNLDSYLIARKKFLEDYDQSMIYLQKNKAKAYPAKVNGRGHLCENFAENGASLEQMICEILLHVADEGKRPDVVFLQIPPIYREALFFNEHPFIDTLMFNSLSINANGQRYSDYLKAKVMSFDGSHFAIADFMKLYMLQFFLDRKNIKFHLVEMKDELKLRYSLATADEYKNIIDSIKQIPILDASPIIESIPDSRCLAGHYKEHIHAIIADRIVALLG